MNEKKVVRLDELHPDERRIVLALIDAQANACAAGNHVMEGDTCKYASAHKVTDPVALKKLAGLIAPVLKKERR